MGWLIILYSVSRFCFLAFYPHFYDSPEYLKQAIFHTSFSQTLFGAHESIHPISLFLNYYLHPSLVAAVFGLVGFISFFYLIKNLFNKKTAFYACLPLIFFSHLWLIQTNIMHESVEQAFFLLGMLCWQKYLAGSKKYFLVLATISFALAICNFVGVVIWFPLIIGLVFLKRQYFNWKNVLRGFAVIIFSGLLAIFILAILMQISGINYQERLTTLFLGYGGGAVVQKWGMAPLLRSLRNIFLITVFGYSPVVFIPLLFVLFSFFKKRQWSRLVFIFIFLLLFLITGKFWYGGFYGRYSVMISYLYALVFGLFYRKKILYWLLIICLLVNFIFTFLAYRKKPIPLIQAELIQKAQINNNDLLIMSDYQRPQLPYPNAVFINGDQLIQKKIEDKITGYLQLGRRVFITQQAITFPYYQYDGQLLHIISFGDRNKAVIKNYLKNKKLKLVVEDKDYTLLNVYEVSN